MASNQQIKTLCEAIWRVEREQDLLQWQIDGVFVWPLIRMRIYYDLVQKMGVFESPHPKQKLSLLGQLMRAGHWVWAALWLSPFRRCGSVKHIVFPHARKVGGVDIYSEQWLKELGEDALVIEENVRPSPEAFTLDAPRILAHVKAVIAAQCCRLNAADRARLRRLDGALSEIAGMSYSARKIVQHHRHKFRYYVPLYERLFRQMKVEYVTLSVAYAKPYIVCAAHLAGAQVIELQHGTITPYHLGYSYPKRPKVPYTPNRLLCFGRYWFEITQLPAGMRSSVIGAPYVKRLAQQAKSSRHSQSIVFCSQGVIASALYDFACQVAQLLPDYQLYYNLHPSERLVDYSKKPRPANVSLICGEPSIFALLAMCEYQAGVFSTTLFEGIALGCKPLLIDLPGIDYMQPLVEQMGALLVATPQAFVARLTEAKCIANTQQFYAPAPQSILQQINADTLTDTR